MWSQRELARRRELVRRRARDEERQQRHVIVQLLREVDPADATTEREK